MSGAAAERFLLGSLRQVRWYMTDDHVRAAAIEAVAERIGPDTRVLVGHSLGSVVAYEALCANPGWPVRALITVGSPLGIPKLIFDRLRPPPSDGKGMWPPGLAMWHNLCDRNDVVAMVKRLGPLFDTGTRSIGDELIDNGWKVHDLGRHLTAVETGRTILAACGLHDFPEKRQHDPGSSRAPAFVSLSVPQRTRTSGETCRAWSAMSTRSSTC